MYPKTFFVEKCPTFTVFKKSDFVIFMAQPKVCTQLLDMRIFGQFGHPALGRQKS
jgi:hypothetical protein